MPGIIKVSVLDFSRSGSGNSVKVSLGNREFQAIDEAEFSFPLTSMRDKIIVSLLDNEVNTVSSEEVETRLVIQKNVWENTLAFEGGGYVHVKFEFTLSDEDRERIRLTRNMAAKMKRDELLNRSKSLETPAISAVFQMERIESRESEVKEEEHGLQKKPQRDDDDEIESCEEERMNADYRDEIVCFEGESMYSSGWIFTDEGMGLCITTAMNNALLKCIADWEFCVVPEMGTGEGNCEMPELVKGKEGEFQVAPPFRKAVEVAIMVGFAVLILFT